MNPEEATRARNAIYEVLVVAHEALYTTRGASWRQIIASIAFETKADLSLIQCFDEHDQARFTTITHALMAKIISQDEVADFYLEFFPRPFDDNYFSKPF